MFWKISCNRSEHLPKVSPSTELKRFVLHRHMDSGGPHLDLRLEQDGYLIGYRIAASSLEGDSWASEKAPHPLAWLEHDGNATRVDAGVYLREGAGDNDVTILLHGGSGVFALQAVRDESITPITTEHIRATAKEHGIALDEVPRLVADGVAARRRAVGRMCGLARELDGAAFDEEVCRRSLQPLSLDDIHAQLRAYEVRFDAKYPPAPVSKPEALAEENQARHGEALAILRE